MCCGCTCTYTYMYIYLCVSIYVMYVYITYICIYIVRVFIYTFCYVYVCMSTQKSELQRLHKSLTAVFPSLHKTSSRRKVPVFCATGSVPLQPALLSSSHSVSQEDWRREREDTRAKLRSYLAADDGKIFTYFSTIFL